MCVFDKNLNEKWLLHPINQVWYFPAKNLLQFSTKKPSVIQNDQHCKIKINENINNYDIQQAKKKFKTHFKKINCSQQQEIFNEVISSLKLNNNNF